MTFNFNAVPAQPGKVAIVTGANTGLGYETTVYLVRKAITVVMACRSQEKAQQAKAEIEAKVPHAQLDILPIDLTDLSSVRAFAAAFREKYNQLDLLINNAGIMFVPYAQTVDGFESQMGVNYFGHFLLTALLLDRMPDDSASRVVSLSSGAHKLVSRMVSRKQASDGKNDDIDFGNLPSEKDYSKVGAYARSKLACLMFSAELQRRLTQASKKVLSVSAHPGMSPTDLARHMPHYQLEILRYTIGPFSHPAKQAALPTVMAALGPDVTGGDYFGPQGWLELKGKPGRVKPSAYSQDLAVAKKALGYI